MCDVLAVYSFPSKDAEARVPPFRGISPSRKTLLVSFSTRRRRSLLFDMGMFSVSMYWLPFTFSTWLFERESWLPAKSGLYLFLLYAWLPATLLTTLPKNFVLLLNFGSTSSFCVPPSMLSSSSYNVNFGDCHPELETKPRGVGEALPVITSSFRGSSSPYPAEF